MMRNLLTAFGLMTVFAATAAYADCVAISYDQVNNTYGSAQGYSSENDALNAAISNCGGTEGCSRVNQSAFARCNMYMALSVSDVDPSIGAPRFGIGASSTAAGAEQAAAGHCANAGGYNCQLVVVLPN